MGIQKTIVATLIVFSGMAHAGRMPTDIISVESVGSGYVKLITSDVKNGYSIIQTADIKRLVSNGEKNKCYMFYFTGAELVKLVVNGQACETILDELSQSKKS